jgi:radical SAM protein
MTQFLYQNKPWFVYWELTRSCELACKHCRAEAIKDRHPLELTFKECQQVVEQIKGFGQPYPHLIVTGGDPLKRPDFFQILEYAISEGIPVSVAPSGTYALDYDSIKRFKDLGVKAMSLSLDGATEASHDAFRGEENCFRWTMEAAHWANDIGMPLQFNTLVCSETKDELDALHATISQFDVLRWSVFFLIPTGRGSSLKSLKPAETEEILHWLYDKMKTSRFPIKTTEAHHFRRIAIEKLMEKGYKQAAIWNSPISRGFGIRDGNGIMFLSHIGDVMPSGFLPASAGNVRKRSLVDVYQNSALFKGLRNVDGFQGKCGYCEFNEVCGGSRARAYAVNGNPNGSDPYCTYKPDPVLKKTREKVI